MSLNLCQLKPRDIPEILPDLTNNQLATLAEYLNSREWKYNWGTMELQRFVVPEMIQRLKLTVDEFSNV